MSDQGVKISVIVCTHNRCESLKDTIYSLQEQDLPASDYEVIVVDNNSLDDTKAVVEELNRSLTVPVHYIFEGTLGLSKARNTGVTNARGAIVGFLDDDVFADRGWLSNLVKVYGEERDAVCVGGRIELKWEVAKPKWWNPAFDKEYGVDHGIERKVLKYPCFPYGSNISFKKSLFLGLGGFSVHFGRKGSQLLGWEEVDLCLRIEKNGGQIYYEPNAIVRHRMTSSVIKRSLALRRSFGYGRSHAMLERKHFGENYVQEKTRKRMNKLFNIGLLTGTSLNVFLYHLGYQLQRFMFKFARGN